MTRDQLEEGKRLWEALLDARDAERHARASRSPITRVRVVTISAEHELSRWLLANSPALLALAERGMQSVPVIGEVG